MPITELHHSTRRESSQRTRRRRFGLWPQGSLAVLAAMVLLAAACYGGASSAEPTSAGSKVVESVDAATAAGEIDLQVVTTALRTPWFAVFPLREPDRLVMDLPGFVWKPGVTAHLPSANPQVEGVRIGQFSNDPLVTRIVFDLAVPAEDLRYRTVSTTESGRLRVQVSDQAKIASAEEWQTPVAAEPRGEEQAARTATPKTVAAASGVAKALRGGVESASAGASANAPEPMASAPAPALETPGIEEETLGEVDAGSADEVAPAAAGVEAETVAPSLAMTERAGGSSRRHLAWILGAAGCLIGIGLLGRWFRRRSRAGETEVPGWPARAPESAGEAGEQADVVRCKIVDGYLVLAPEGDGSGLSDLSAAPRREAKVRGSVELTVGAVRDEVDDESEQAPTEGPAVQARTLIGALSDESVAVRKAAAQGLWELAGRGNVDVLLPYLKSEDPRIRLVIAGVLGEAGAAKYAGALAEIVEDADPSVRASVLYAFAQLGERTRDYSDAVRGRLSDAEGSVRARAVEALAAMNPKSEAVASEILGLTGDEDSAVREAAVSASFSFLSWGVTGPMLGLLADAGRRPHAFEVLQQGDDGAMRRLLIAARIAAPEVGERALETISYVMSRRWTVDGFAGELASSDPEDRLAAVEGLAMVGGDDAARELAGLAERDPSPLVRRRAAEIVGRWKELTPQGAGRPGGSNVDPSDA